MSIGSKVRQQQNAKRCAKLRRQGLTLGQIAEATGIERERIATRITLGERLLSIEEG